MPLKACSCLRLLAILSPSCFFGSIKILKFLFQAIIQFKSTYCQNISSTPHDWKNYRFTYSLSTYKFLYFCLTKERINYQDVTTEPTILEVITFKKNINYRVRFSLYCKVAKFVQINKVKQKLGIFLTRGSVEHFTPFVSLWWDIIKLRVRLGHHAELEFLN